MIIIFYQSPITNHIIRVTEKDQWIQKFIRSPYELVPLHFE